jgi:hypothetical protein
VVAVLDERWEVARRLPASRDWVLAMCLASALMAVEILGVTAETIPFVYFQF